MFRVKEGRLWRDSCSVLMDHILAVQRRRDREDSREGAAVREDREGAAAASPGGLLQPTVVPGKKE